MWRDPEASDDEEVRPPLVDDDSSADELIEDKGEEVEGQQVTEDVYDTGDEIIFNDWVSQSSMTGLARKYTVAEAKEKQH